MRKHFTLSGKLKKIKQNKKLGITPNFVRDHVLQQFYYANKIKKLTAKCKSALVSVGLSLIGAAAGCAAGGIGCAIGIAYHWKAIVDAGIACN